ncbi:hypothetical protein CYMTET_27612 [Cymbomonas tetramitiformis]|uniref:Kinesin light chain n=1 Tax=Cymbomonas tetramitiformis TaxID=36881 RepID=A0AAE0F141_9CHLO|nr:hypothetical protein CYMTET_44019 [Cymbomonas tetramitiformis]KAK3263590.1 hypothetical protein CYMTET_27612 [Cymbomonas tetramitiformis]|eukprot:gene25356-30955_t
MGCGASCKRSSYLHAATLQGHGEFSELGLNPEGPLVERDNFPTEGLSLAALRRFTVEHEAHLARGPTTREVCEELVKPATSAAQLSYAEMQGSSEAPVGSATVFVSHTWQRPFSELAEAVLTLEGAEDHPEEVLVWIDVFCANQHRSEERGAAWWSAALRNAARGFNRTLVVLAPFPEPVLLTRAACLFELFCTLDAGAALDLRLPLAAFAALKARLRDGELDPDQWVRTVDLGRAEARDPQELAEILEAARVAGGVGRVNACLQEALEAGVAALGRRAQAALASEKPAQTGNLSQLARLPSDRNGRVAAEPLHRKVLEGRREELGATHPYTLKSINTLGAVLQDQGKLEEAEELYREALDTGRAELGASHPDTLSSINNLAGLLTDQGKLDEAEPLYREALDKGRAELGANHPDILGSINNLAILLTDRGQLKEAEPLYREALEGGRKKLGPDHPDTLSSINNLAGLLTDRGKLDEAEPLFCEALEGRRVRLGADHPDTLSSMSDLANLMSDMGMMDDAEPLYREALEGRRTKLGADHPDTLSTISDLAFLLNNQGMLDEAEQLYREVLEERRAKLGARHADTLGAVNDLAILLNDKGKLDEAEPLYREVLEAVRAMPGRHTDTLSCIRNLSGLLFEQGKLDEAERQCREAVELGRATLGADHPSTLSSAQDLADLLAVRDERSVEEAPYRVPLEAKA